jgi:hypothetical protein
MSDVRRFTLDDMKFEVSVATDPSSGEANVWVYRIDVFPREHVATGEPDALNLAPAYRVWEDCLGVLEQAVMDSLRDVPE